MFTDNHMNIDKTNHPQLLRQEQPFIWPMVIQIGNEIYRNGTKRNETQRNLPKRNETERNEMKWNEIYRNETEPVSFRFGKLRCVSFRFVPLRYISFRVSFRILQVPLV
jgi:hypothetical protein